jgi:hypothetical protein
VSAHGLGGGDRASVSELRSRQHNLTTVQVNKIKLPWALEGQGDLGLV